MLAVSTTPDERRGRMGHGPNDKTYWWHYRKKTGTFDFQAHAYGAEPKDLSFLSSLLLNFKSHTPRVLSHEELVKIYAHPDLISLAATKDDTVDTCILIRGSVQGPAEKGSEHYDKYQEIRCKYGNTLRVLMAKALKHEYGNHFKEDCQVGPIATEPVVLKSERIIDEAKEVPEIEALSLNRRSPILTRRIQFGLGRSITLACTVVDDIPNALNDSSGLSDSNLVNLLITSFNHLHAADAYCPGQEPLPGTCECRFCGKVLKGAYDRHAKTCQCQYLLDHLPKQLTDALKPLHEYSWINEDGEMCTYKYSGNAPPKQR